MKRNQWEKRSSARFAIAFLTAIMMMPFSYAGIAIAEGERKLICGLEEHTHTDACYEKQLICGQDEKEDTTKASTWSFVSTFQTHTHSDQCRDNDGALVCGIAENEYFHTHNDYCKDQDGNIICGLEEKKPHEHTETCYQTERVLTCTIPVGDGAHEHTSECMGYPFICGLVEHAHTDVCYEQSNELVCGKEAHTHGDGNCNKLKLTCENTDIKHVHTDACYTCDKEEHTHTDECYKKLICNLEPHTHSDTCRSTEPQYICGKEPSDGHQHGDGCYINVNKLTCTQLTDHKHSSTCWDENGKLICGQLEVPVFTCTEANRSVTPGQTIAGHKHTDVCYQKTDKLICGKEAHTHSDSCYKTETVANNTQSDVQPTEQTDQSQSVEQTGDQSTQTQTVEQSSDQSTQTQTIEQSSDQSAQTQTDEQSSDQSAQSQTVEQPIDQSAQKQPVEQPVNQSVQEQTADIRGNNTQTTTVKEGVIAGETRESNTGTASDEPARDPNKTYAPDGSEYNPNAGDTDKSGLVAVSGGAQGPSFNITDPVKTDTSKYQLTTARTTGSVKTVSSTGASSGPAGATATTSTDSEEDTDGDDKTDEADDTDGTAYEGVYSIAGGYNVILIGLAESNIQSETWPLLMQRGIVFEDFERGDAPEDTEALLQDGIEGVKQDGTSNYWNSPSAAATAGDLINQFGFYGMMEEEKQTDDAQMLAKTAERITGEGLVMNARNIPFFMDVQFTGNGGQGDTLRQLITELENDGLGGNTVLIFTQTGKEAKGPLVIVHPVVWENMTVETPMKAEDLLTTILSLSGQAKASQYEQLGMPAGKNLLTMEELQGIVGLVPELKAEEEVTADAEETTERDDSEGDTSDSPKFKMPEDVKKNGMPDGIEQEKNRIEINRTKVTTNPNGQGSGPAAPGSDVPKSNGPGGDSSQDDYSAGPGGPGGEPFYSDGPGGSGNGEVSYSAGPGGSGNADDSYSAGPGGTGAGEVYSVGPGGGGSDGGPAHP